MKRNATDVLLFFNFVFLAYKKFFAKTFFTAMARRSMSITDDDVEIFIEGEENENTKKTEQDSSLIKSFIASEKQTNEPVEIEKLSPEELDSYLRKFLLAVRKKDGDEFEPTTLRGFLSSVERYLKKHPHSESVTTGHHFARTRDTLKSKQKELKTQRN